MSPWLVLLICIGGFVLLNVLFNPSAHIKIRNFIAHKKERKRKNKVGTVLKHGTIRNIWASLTRRTKKWIFAAIAVIVVAILSIVIVNETSPMNTRFLGLKWGDKQSTIISRVGWDSHISDNKVWCSSFEYLDETFFRATFNFNQNDELVSIILENLSKYEYDKLYAHFSRYDREPHEYTYQDYTEWIYGNTIVRMNGFMVVLQSRMDID